MSRRDNPAGPLFIKATSARFADGRASSATPRAGEFSREGDTFTAKSGLRVLIFGSRNWINLRVIAREISRLPSDAVVIEGGSGGERLWDPIHKRYLPIPHGADYLAGKAGHARGLEVEEHRVTAGDWRRFGRAAGIRRNLEMLRKGRPEIAIGLWDGRSPGSAHMKRSAEKAGIGVRIIVNPAACLVLSAEIDECEASIL